MKEQNEVDAALAELMNLAGSAASKNTDKHAPGKKSKPKKKRPFWWRVSRWVMPPVVLGLLPFVALLKGSTVLYRLTDLPVWLCLTAAGFGAGVFILLAIWRVSKKIKISLPGGTFRISLILAGLYVGFTLLYVSADNVKNPEIQTTYQSLHPMLRLAVSSMVLVDSDAVITDSERVVEDYAAMGLSSDAGSLHFEQADGYVHALDLRTIGRTEFRNRLTALYFRILGFRTLRHVGTADHLHISLGLR